MLTRIRAYLEENPGSKASEIARSLSAEKSRVNSLLYAHENVFSKGEDSRWFVKPLKLTIELGDTWLTSRKLERKLQRYPSTLDSDYQTVEFSVGSCKLMLEAQARLLALCNQLSEANKLVVLDFKTSDNSSLSYLDRIGFFELLAPAVQVLPARPQEGRSQTYRGNNEGVIELRKIDPSSPTREVTDLLHRSFIGCAGSNYDTAALTIIGELYTNVIEHCGTTSHGFAGLQFYQRTTKHIQVIISDNGKGIIGTLSPLLKTKYPAVAKRIRDSADPAGIALLKEVFINGSISQTGLKGRGLGLKRSGVLAKKFQASITIRQKSSELKIHQDGEQMSFEHWSDLVRIDGTHICFDFLLDAPKDKSLN